MSYRIRYDKRAYKALAKIDKHTRMLILSYIDKYLEGCENPRLKGKALGGDKAGMWRYRIGDYRVLAKIDDEAVTVYIFKIGHRRETYSN